MLCRSYWSFVETLLKPVWFKLEVNVRRTKVCEYCRWVTMALSTLTSFGGINCVAFFSLSSVAFDSNASCSSSEKASSSSTVQPLSATFRETPFPSAVTSRNALLRMEATTCARGLNFRIFLNPRTLPIETGRFSRPAHCSRRNSSKGRFSSEK